MGGRLILRQGSLQRTASDASLPGYLPDGTPVLGYHEVTLHHIAALAEDIWGDHAIREGHAVPCPQDRTGKPRGKWRRRKKRELYGEAHWYMQRTVETGRRINTTDFEKHRFGGDEWR